MKDILHLLADSIEHPRYDSNIIDERTGNPVWNSIRGHNGNVLAELI